MTNTTNLSLVPWITRKMKKVYRVCYTLFKSGIGGVFRKNAPIIIWIPNIFSLRYFGRDRFIKDMALIKALRVRNLAFTIHFGQNIGKFNNKVIFYNVDRQYNIYAFDNYMTILEYISGQLERQNNLVFLTNNEVRYWENKVYMHQKFEEYHIPHPKTRIISEARDLQNQDMTFPLLLKESHSSSAEGVFKVNNLSELTNLIESPDMKKRNEGIFIVQELLNIRRDLRVILVGSEIVLHYWRINKSDTWRPTSTSFGSKVDFNHFPEQWRNHILETFKKLNIITGAFDIAWQNDDLTTPPLYLEISPNYQPNPKPYKELPYYGAWKKSFNLFNSYEIAFVDVIFDIADKYVAECLKKVDKQKVMEK